MINILRNIANNFYQIFFMILSGILYAISFPGIELWYLSFIAFVPMILVLQGKTPKQAFWLSWLMGTISMAIGFYWLVGMLQQFSGFNIILCIFFSLLVWLQKGGLFALAGWLYAKSMQAGYKNLLFFVASYAIAELIYPVLFSWYYAASLHKIPELLQLADIGGPIIITILILVINVLIAEVILYFINKYYYKNLNTKLNKSVIIFALSFFIIAYIYSIYKINKIDDLINNTDNSNTLNIGMVQANMPLMSRNKQKFDQVPYDLTNKLINQAKDKNINLDLVVWSESGSARIVDAKNYRQDAKNKITGLLGVPAIIGVSLYEKIDSKNNKYKFYNTALLSEKDGNIMGRYDKQYLLAFGEYIPFGSWFPVLYDISPNSGRFESGKSLKPFKFKKNNTVHNIGINICYEDILPYFVNKQISIGNSDLLVNITNDTWFGDTTEPWEHFALAKFRAIEHHKYMIRVTNSGVTAIIDPLGRVSEVSGILKPQIMLGEVKFLSGRSIYSYIGNTPWWILTIVFVYLVFVRKKV